jgi:hypothetical protein
MRANYIKLTANTMETLPAEKQAEIYDFAKFVKEKTKNSTKKSTRQNASILDIIGIGESGCSDISLNHDKYLYDQE